jgi:hypothetical protein
VLCLGCAAFLGGFLLPHAFARADEPAPRSTVTVLLAAALDDPRATRIAAEIRALGMVVANVTVATATRIGFDVQIQARSADAAGVVDIDTGAGEVRIWTAERLTGRILLRSTLRLDEEEAVVALRVVEVLRASLNGLDVPPPAKTVLPPTPPIDRPSRPATRYSRFGVSLGPALAFGGSGRFGGSWEGTASAYWLWEPRWGVEVMGVAPLTSARQVDAAGSATLTFVLVVAGVRARAVAARWCVLDVGAGMGAAGIHTRGYPNPGFSGTDTTTWLAAPYTRIEYAVSVAPLLWLLASMTGALALPPTSFTFAGERSSWGLPVLLASVGVEVVFR